MAAEIEKGPILGQRHLQILLLFLSIVVNFIAKLNVGVSVVAMTNAATTNPNFPEYDWTEMQKSFIISSFFWGYIVTQFPGGYFCRHFGAKKIMFVSTLGSAMFALLIPVAVDWGGWQVYCGIRVIQGLFQGLLFPCIHAYLAVWCPVEERNRLGALANTGIECGTVLAMYLSGIIASSSLGWPGISYISFGLGAIWCLFWLILATNTPNESKLISERERSYIENSKNSLKENISDNTGKSIPVPWRAIVTSLPFWSLLAVRMAHAWGFSTLQAEIPSYMNGVLGMDMNDNALFSALPYFAMWIMSYVYLVLADVLLYNKILSLNALRKIFNSLALWIPAVGLVLIGFLGEDQKTLAIVLMTVNVGINAGNTIGSTLNTIDLSPNHAGILMGIGNTFANVIPIATPLLVGAIVEDETDRSGWQIVFGIAAAIFAVGNLIFVLFGSTDLQPWDDEHFLMKNDEQHVESCKKESSDFKECK